MKIKLKPKNIEKFFVKMSELVKKISFEVAKVNENAAPDKTKIEMKNYILDDLVALKKKWNMINHKPEIDVNGEASNGSSINVDMKTSLFEMMKTVLISALKDDVEIDEINFPVTSKAASKNGEEADVEYHVDISFTYKGVKDKIKMKCFTTKCRIQIQNFGKHERKKHLGNEYIPKLFVSRFIVPFLESVLEKSVEFEKVFVPHLKLEIQRLQKKKIQEKSRKGSFIDTDSKTAKCENQNCQHKSNVTLKNVGAYGCCSNCKGYEHFHCAGTSKVMKEEIVIGKAIFICTNCMEKNPALGKDVSMQLPWL